MLLVILLVHDVRMEEGDAVASKDLKKAVDLLASLSQSGTDTVGIGRLADQWLDVREQIVHFMCDWNYPHLPAKRSAYLRKVRWRQDYTE